MAYSDVVLLASDNDFTMRTAACAATEQIEFSDGQSASNWAFDHVWQMAAMPGFGDKYASALANGIVRPGNDPSVISDGDILSAVQSLVA